jgi:cell division protein FtsZ
MDFMDVKTVISQGGGAMIGTGRATGQSRATEAAKEAISGPLLDGISIEGAKALLVNIQSSPDIRFSEFDEAMATITRAAGNQAQCFLGTSFRDDLGDELKITVIATGFGKPVQREPEEMVLPASMGIPFPIAQGTGREHERETFRSSGSGAELSRNNSSVPSFLRRAVD